MGPLRGIWEIGEERATCDGSSKSVEIGEKGGGGGGNYPAMLKICKRKMAK